MRRVLVVVGTRPEAIKLAPVVQALGFARPTLAPILCATAQHREMLDQVLELFQLHPDHDLDVMQEGQGPSMVVRSVLERLGALLREVRPDLVLVQGDTASAMAAALAAYFARVPVGHVEAGLRTDDRYSPFPEEMMRRLITPLASLNFAATERAAAHLHAEGVPEAEIYVTGNPVVDALLAIRQRARHGVVAPGRQLILVTAHRRENFGAPLRRICEAIAQIVERNPNVEVVYPVHPNPEVTGPVHELLGGRTRIRLVPPLPYDEFIGLLDCATIVLSDSGGLQEEAPVLGKPLLVLRDTTERQEGLDAGTTAMVGSDTGRIVAEAERLLRDAAAYARMSKPQSPFGDGHAAERIVAILRQVLAGEGDGADAYRYVDRGERG